MQKLVDEARVVSDGDPITNGDHSKMKTTAEILIEKAAHYVQKYPRRFPSGIKSWNVIAQAIEAWAKETGEDQSKLPRYFETKADGKFYLPFLNRI
jgi:hypothetical protein